MTFLNLTQHVATPEQLADGVIEPTSEDKENIKTLLTFSVLPNAETILLVADALASIAEKYKWLPVGAKDENLCAALIDGPSFLLPCLGKELHNVGINPVFSFTNADGKHKGFILFI